MSPFRRDIQGDRTLIKHSITATPGHRHQPWVGLNRFEKVFVTIATIDSQHTELFTPGEMGGIQEGMDLSKTNLGTRGIRRHSGHL